LHDEPRSARRERDERVGGMRAAAMNRVGLTLRSPARTRTECFAALLVHLAPRERAATRAGHARREGRVGAQRGVRPPHVRDAFHSHGSPCATSHLLVVSFEPEHLDISAAIAFDSTPDGPTDELQTQAAVVQICWIMDIHIDILSAAHNAFLLVHQTSDLQRV
jgi:hypothetical protein